MPALEDNLVVRVAPGVKPAATLRAMDDGYPDLSAVVRVLVADYAAGRIAAPAYVPEPVDPRREQLFALVDSGKSLTAAVAEVGCVYRTGRRWLEERAVSAVASGAQA